MPIQNYELGEQFMAVGPSTFYRARNVILGHPVVVRRVSVDPERAEDVRQTFYREARHAAALGHARIWKPLDVFESEGHLWSVHEDRTARTTEIVVRESGVLSLARAARMGVQVADALAHMHSKGFVHGKVTPRTVTVDADGDVQLINFVKSADLAAGIWPLRPIVLGLSAFSAPEEVAGERPTPERPLRAGRDDRLLADGPLPPRRREEQAAFERVQAGRARWTRRALKNDLPAALARAVVSALEPDPRARHGSVAALGSLLAEIERRLARRGPGGLRAGGHAGPGVRGGRRPDRRAPRRGRVRHRLPRHGLQGRGGRRGLRGGRQGPQARAPRRPRRRASASCARRARIEGIDHPNVVHIRGVGEQRGTPYAVMEFVPGPDLGTLLLREGAARRRSARRALAAGVARGPRGDPPRGHRPPRPEAPQRARRRRGPRPPVIADFGVARSLAQARLTMTGQLVGTPGLHGARAGLERRSPIAIDLYALGAILYEMLAGTTPFAGGDTIGTLRRIREEPHPPLPASVPTPLRDLVDRLLAKSPLARPVDADAVAGALEAFAGLTPPAPPGCSDLDLARCGNPPSPDGV